MTLTLKNGREHVHMERQQAYTHTLRTRTSHWINAAVIVFLLWTGFSMFAGDRHFAWIVRMLPSAFWHAVHFAGTKRQLLTWHVYAGTFFGINGIAYIAALIATGAWRRIVPAGNRWAHDPHRPLEYSLPQRMAYSGIVVGAGLMVFTGAALWLKHQIPWLLTSLGGERIVLPVHVLLATGVLSFACIHVLQVLRSGLPVLRSMTVGGTLSKAHAPVRLPVETRF